MISVTAQCHSGQFWQQEASKFLLRSPNDGNPAGPLGAWGRARAETNINSKKGRACRGMAVPAVFTPLLAADQASFQCGCANMEYPHWGNSTLAYHSMKVQAGFPERYSISRLISARPTCRSFSFRSKIALLSQMQTCFLRNTRDKNTNAHTHTHTHILSLSLSLSRSPASQDDDAWNREADFNRSRNMDAP